jgi:iron(III) transport system ATP-binding protein
VAALRGLDLAAVDGRVTAVLGPSGCGKTTLLRILAGSQRPDAGTVTLGDRVLCAPGVRVPPEQRRIGLVPQEGALFPHLDVAGNVAYGINRRARAERRARVDELLELVGLPGYGDRRPHELSGGQQQRVALARALAPSPEVILLDEPFSALDTSLRGSLRDEVMGTLRRAGITVVLVTHDRAEAMSLADDVAVVRAGRVVQVGPGAELYRCPADLWTARFLGDAVVLAGTRPAGGAAVVDTALGRLVLRGDAEHHPGPEVTVLLRPEQLRRTTTPHPTGAAAAAEPGIDAEITEVRFHGPDATVTLRVGEVLVAARWPSTDLAAAGTSVRLAVVGDAVAFAPESRT